MNLQDSTKAVLLIIIGALRDKVAGPYENLPRREMRTEDEHECHDQVNDSRDSDCVTNSSHTTSTFFDNEHTTLLA